FRQQLLRRGLFSVHVARRIRPALKWKQRRAGRAIENEHLTMLSRERDRINRLAAASERHECRRRREVTIPDVVMHRLEMAETPAASRIEREQRARRPVR